MDSASVGMNGQLGMEIAIAVAKQQQDAAKQQGDAALKLLESAVEVQQQSQSGGSGGRPMALGKGATIDLIA